MKRRYDNAIAIQQGACNPSGICHSIIAACQEVRDEGGGTDQIRADPAVRLMVHQLAFLCAIAEIDSDISLYARLTDECVAGMEANA